MSAVSASPPRAERAPLGRDALAIWRRFLAPLTSLSAIALAPVWLVALAIAPADRANAATLAWLLLALALPGQLMLVGVAAAMSHGQLSQLNALRAGMRGLLAAIVPCLAALAAVALGGLALAVPAAILLILLSLSGASQARGIPAALADSAAVARKHLPAVVAAVAALVAIDVAIRLVAERAVIGALAKPASSAQLLASRRFIQVMTAALIIASPIPAAWLAQIRRREP